MQTEDSNPIESTPTTRASEPAPQAAAQPPAETAPPVKRPRSGLSAIQELALEHLTAGVSIADTARAARVDRRTLHRWIRDDARFAAAYNAWRQEVIDSGRARVLAMANRALNTMNAAIEKGDARVAVQVAKATGAMDAPKPGSADAAMVRRQRKLDDEQHQIELEEAEAKIWQYRRAKEKDEAWMRDVNSLAGLLDSLIKQFKEALDAEPPEQREQRRTGYNPYSRTHRLLELLLSDHVYAKAFDRPKYAQDIQPPTDLSPTWPPAPDWVPPPAPGRGPRGVHPARPAGHQSPGHPRPQPALRPRCLRSLRRVLRVRTTVMGGADHSCLPSDRPSGDISVPRGDPNLARDWKNAQRHNRGGCGR
ncbi:MAG TPA: hypothetical protein VGI81_00145 [Tepidisphaeraceae bacterium]